MKLQLENIGQINRADLTFRDLTVFVGPQATGKSIALQFLKLMVDAGHVQDELNRYGLDWSGQLPRFFDIYFGEGMRSLWRKGQSAVTWKNKPVNVEGIIKRKRRDTSESLFLIPAQRVLTLPDGWPRPFTDYSPGDPFAVREFSERLRMLLEREFHAKERLFPQSNRLKKGFRDMLDRTIFSGFQLHVDKSRVQKRLVLDAEGNRLPYMVWSAGQREFIPLLMGLYWLMPPSRVSRRGSIEWVVIEELEMGLHPRAINALLMMIFELLGRDYRVCLSTHSPQVLEAVWALQHLRQSRADPSLLLDIFEAPKTQPMKALADDVMKKKVAIHYFDRTTGTSRDITKLDVDAEELGQSGWGGLAEFSGRANDAVAAAVANAARRRSK